MTESGKSMGGAVGSAERGGSAGGSRAGRAYSDRGRGGVQGRTGIQPKRLWLAAAATWGSAALLLLLGSFLLSREALQLQWGVWIPRWTALVSSGVGAAVVASGLNGRRVLAIPMEMLIAVASLLCLGLLAGEGSIAYPARLLENSLWCLPGSITGCILSTGKSNVRRRDYK